MRKVMNLFIVQCPGADDLFVRDVTAEQLAECEVYKIMTDIDFANGVMEQKAFVFHSSNREERWVLLPNDSPEAETQREAATARMPELEPAKLVQRVYATGRPIATCEYLEREGLKVVREGEVTYEGGKSQVVLWVQGTEEQHERVEMNINENMVYPGDEE